MTDHSHPPREVGATFVVVDGTRYDAPAVRKATVTRATKTTVTFDLENTAPQTVTVKPDEPARPGGKSYTERGTQRGAWTLSATMLCKTCDSDEIVRARRRYNQAARLTNTEAAIRQVAYTRRLDPASTREKIDLAVEWLTAWQADDDARIAEGSDR